MKIKTADLTATGHDYLAWAAQALSCASRPLTEFSAAAAHPMTHALMSATGLPPDQAAWLTGVTLALQRTHRAELPGMLAGEEAPPLIYRWAEVAPILPDGKIGINQRRFERWLDAETWDDFFRHTEEALRVIRDKPFRMADLYDIATERTADIDGWKMRAAELFQRYRPAGPHLAAPPYDSRRSEKMGVLTIHLPMRKKTAYVKAAHTEGKKLATWVLEQLDAAVGER